jgi:hypothetical protein
MASSTTNSFVLKARCLALLGLALVTIANADSKFSESHYHARALEATEGFGEFLDGYLAEQGIGRQLRPRDKRKYRPHQKSENTPKKKAYRPRKKTPQVKVVREKPVGLKLKECLQEVVEFGRIGTRPLLDDTSSQPPLRATRGPLATTATDSPSESVFPSDSSTELPTYFPTEENTDARRKLLNKHEADDAMGQFIDNFIDVYDDEYDEVKQDYSEHYLIPSWLKDHTFDEMKRRLSTCNLPMDRGNGVSRNQLAFHDAPLMYASGFFLSKTSHNALVNCPHFSGMLHICITITIEQINDCFARFKPDDLCTESASPSLSPTVKGIIEPTDPPRVILTPSPTPGKGSKSKGKGGKSKGKGSKSKGKGSKSKGKGSKSKGKGKGEKGSKTPVAYYGKGKGKGEKGSKAPVAYYGKGKGKGKGAKSNGYYSKGDSKDDSDGDSASERSDDSNGDGRDDMVESKYSQKSSKKSKYDKARQFNAGDMNAEGEAYDDEDDDSEDYYSADYYSEDYGSEDEEEEDDDDYDNDEYDDDDDDDGSYATTSPVATRQRGLFNYDYYHDENKIAEKEYRILKQAFDQCVDDLIQVSGKICGIQTLFDQQCLAL